MSGIVHGIGLGFALYLSLVVVFAVGLPIVWHRRWLARLVTSFASRVTIPAALWMAGVRVRSRGLEHARALEAGKGYILIANHSSNLDPMALMKVLGRTDLAFVAKAETLRRPGLGYLLRCIGWFAVERESPVAFKRFEEQVKARRKAGWVPNLVVFPEGTRSVDGVLQPFRMGTFLLAAQTRLPILPVIIRGAAPLHRRNAFACYPGTVRVDILPPLLPPSGKLGANELIAAVADLQNRAEALYRSVGDLNQVDGDLPEVDGIAVAPAIAPEPSESAT